ncbi:hypothetical protein AZE42_03979 [Rhizopogon vesiculosus]|uniref:DNA2/NAM7 helicase-like C-terminal domain-containing protein n=1 Tax=Rhizopogon vesiculosus TaxID=180088 RepID=A0A1J8Q0W4_9AGAM|nr:hypothetical protein AZE42_03979 [Rhizopogon vesiculosus]
MLSSFTLRKFGGFTTAPIKTLVIDEASQIETGDYIPLFTSHSTIRKEDIQELKSIFEVKHLKKCAIFLNIQYRMPPQIGWFISQAIYDSELDSNPEHPITTERMACHFINIPSEEQPHGTSWKASCFISSLSVAIDRPRA